VTTGKREILEEQRDFSNRVTFDFDSVDADMYTIITQSIVEKFNLKPKNKLLEGVEEIFQDFKIDKAVLGLEWDIWSGYTVVAKNKEAKELVRDVAEFINLTHITKTHKG
jgi:hypothetical protein